MVGNKDADYPKLGPGTSHKDFYEARFVMSSSPCTTLDLEHYRMYDKGHVSDKNNDYGYD